MIEPCKTNSQNQTYIQKEPEKPGKTISKERSQTKPERNRQK
jgi:hypothetical protein